MKKSLFIVTALVALGLAACGGSGSSSSKAPESSKAPTPVVPTEDGKCTFFLKTTETCIQFKEYETIYLTGGAFGWKTGYEALEMKALAEDKTIFYTIVANDAFDTTANQGLEFQLVLGYNSKAKMPDAASGLQWVDGRKSDECAAPGGLSNLSFQYQPGQMTVDLGSHTFSTSLPTPSAPLKNYSFKVEFAEAVPEYGKVVIFGSFNGWNTPKGTEETKGADKALIDSLTMVPDAERKVFTLKFDEMVAGNYECKILVEYVATAVYNVTWNAIDQTKENYGFTVNQADGDGYVLEILDEEATFKLADPDAKLEHVGIIVLNSGETKALENLYFAGVFNGWTPTALESLPSGAFGCYFDDVTGGTKEFKLLATEGWDFPICFEGNANIAVELEVGEHKNAVITISFDWNDPKLGAEQVVITEENIQVAYDVEE